MSQSVARPAPGTRLRGFSASVILLLGVLVVPMALVLIFNSYSAPDAAAYVRMAFAQVAGSTIAIVTVAGLVLHRVVRRSAPSEIAWLALIAVVIGSWQLAGMGSAAETLLTRLGISG
ncbi:hypothetical protein [Marisediminicola antarctica]|uniref:hypothetical protein n=1 Tax=Marisediminicola antarctica TaxID=674079 RepID=UPI00137B65FB|nr:hypothetical protein [Marisediminicola antarctica]